MLFFFTKVEEMSRVGSRDCHMEWGSKSRGVFFVGPGQPKGLPNFRTSNIFHTLLPTLVRTQE